MLLKGHILLLLLLLTALTINMVAYYYEVDITLGSNSYHCIVIVDLSSEGTQLVKGKCHSLLPSSGNPITYLTSSSGVGNIITPYLLSGKNVGKIETELNGTKLIVTWKLITKQKFTMLSYAGVLIVSLISGGVIIAATYVLLNREKYIID